MSKFDDEQKYNSPLSDQLWTTTERINGADGYIWRQTIRTNIRPMTTFEWTIIILTLISCPIVWWWLQP